MQDHLFRQKVSFHKKLANGLESIVYQAVEIDHLIAREDLEKRVALYCDGKRAKPVCMGEIRAAVNALIDNGFLKVAGGHLLDCFLKSI